MRQHLIDPETCIRCNTCETRCPTKAISHEKNYVVDPDRCNACRKCVRPCPTGAIDHWIEVSTPHQPSSQLKWSRLPREVVAAEAAVPTAMLDHGTSRLAAEADMSPDGPARRPATASSPEVNVFPVSAPARAVVSGNLRITSDLGRADVHHIILDFGSTRFPYLEGQSVGIVPPGLERDGSRSAMRLYSIASARDGERPNTNNMALAVRRVVRHDRNGQACRGLASNWLCDLPVGHEIEVIGPFGSTFLMPDDPAADILMVCTGTGVSPFRGFTHRRRRHAPDASGRLYLLYGARSADDLPYFGPLQGYAQDELHRELVYSRRDGSEREYVQDRLRAMSQTVAGLLRKTSTHFYICGLRGLEAGIETAMTDICIENDLDWVITRGAMLRAGRFHVEVY